MDDLPPDLDSVYVDKQDSASIAAALPLPLRQASNGKLVGWSEQMVAVLSEIDKVARSSCTVLITGESGAGKEMVVSALHDASPRRRAPLVAVNCGAIPEHLLESELFGHAKGAFPGAHTARQGRVAAAEGGTLFLDEVGELPLTLQVKLLRLLQQKEYSPVGDDRTVKCDIRVVAATHKNLEFEVQEGRFREDLYSRLNVFCVHVPPLRERDDDVEPNIRVQDLPARLRSPDAAPISGVRTLPDEGIDLRAAVEEFESNLILQALAKTGNNKNKAAQLLKLNRTTLVEMVKRKKLRVA